MQFNLTREQVKKRVLEIHKQKMKQNGAFLTLGSCYEFAAKILGYENWDTFSALLKREENEPN